MPDLFVQLAATLKDRQHISRLYKPLIVDFHNHYQPPKYLEVLERGPSAVRITRDVEGNPRWIILSDYNIAVRASHHARNPWKPITSVDPEVP